MLNSLTETVMVLYICMLLNIFEESSIEMETSFQNVLFSGCFQFSERLCNLTGKCQNRGKVCDEHFFPGVEGA